MKTLEEIYREVIASEQLKTEFAAAVKAGTVGAFLTAHGCDATSAEATTFLKERQAREGELADRSLMPLQAVVAATRMAALCPLLQALKCRSPA